MENAYVFDVFPIYWQTEIVQGKTELIGDAHVKSPIVAFEIPPPAEPPVENTIISASAEFLSESETEDWIFVSEVTPEWIFITMGLYITGSLIIKVS